MSAINHFYFKGALKETIPSKGYMTDDGLQTGSQDLTIDGSITPVTFFLPVANNEVLQVFQVTIGLVDNGTPGFGDFGNINNGLTIGLQVFFDKNGTTYNGSNYKTNDDLLSESTTYDEVNYSGSDRGHAFRHNLVTHSNGILLHGNTNDRIGIIVSDDLSSMTHLNCFIRGHIRTLD